MEPLKELHVAPVGAGHFQLDRESRHPDVKGADALSDGAVPQRTRYKGFPDPCRADQDEIVVLPDPVVLAKPEQAVFDDAPSCPEVDILEARRRVPEVRL